MLVLYLCLAIRRVLFWTICRRRRPSEGEELDSARTPLGEAAALPKLPLLRCFGNFAIFEFVKKRGGWRVREI